MNRILILFSFALLMGISVSAHGQTSADFERRYNQLVARVGYDGPGVETLLDNWSKVDSLNAGLLTARFYCCFFKSQGTEVKITSQKKYLGKEAVLSLQDTTGANVYYHEVNVYDDEMFAKAVYALDKAVSVYPERLDFRFLKTNAYVTYEGESPDMALAELMMLSDEIYSRPWTYHGEKVDPVFLEEAMQEYCFTFYNMATDASYEAFYRLSERMMEVCPDNPEFMANIGSYHMAVKKDYKTAMKYYDKVLKKHPDNNSAILNGIRASRLMNNTKKEVKYLKLLIQYGDDEYKRLYEGRIKALIG